MPFQKPSVSHQAHTGGLSRAAAQAAKTGSFPASVSSTGPSIISPALPVYQQMLSCPQRTEREGNKRTEPQMAGRAVPTLAVSETSLLLWSLPASWEKWGRCVVQQGDRCKPRGINFSRLGR